MDSLDSFFRKWKMGEIKKEEEEEKKRYEKKCPNCPFLSFPLFYGASAWTKAWTVLDSLDSFLDNCDPSLVWRTSHCHEQRISDGLQYLHQLLLIVFAGFAGALTLVTW